MLLGVGLDDTFVMISAWKRSSGSSEQTYSKAAVAITVTTLTNLISFAVGVAFPEFRSISIFCLYTGVALAFIYAYNLLLFGPLFVQYMVLFTL